MSQKFIVETKSGRPDSLKQSVRIMFTLTPTQSSHTFCPIAYKVMDFPGDGEQTQELEWRSRFDFDTAEALTGRTYKTTPVPLSPDVLPGQVVSLATLPGGNIRWGPPAPSSQSPDGPAIEVLNNTGSAQIILLRVASRTSVAVFTSVPNNERVVIGELKLQAYVADASRSYSCELLQPADLIHPLTTPLLCKDLSAISTWTLSQDRNGDIKLTNNADAALGQIPPDNSMGDLARSIADMKTQLSGVLERLGRMEDSLARTQNDVTEGRQIIDSMQAQQSKTEGSNGLTKEEVESMIRASISALTLDHQVPGLDRRVPALEVRTDKLAKSFGQTQEYLTGVQKFFQTTRDQVAALDRMIPAVEAKAEKIANSVSRNREDILGIKSSHGDQIVALESRVKVVEEETVQLTAALEEIRLGGPGGSPIMFPSQALETPASPVLLAARTSALGPAPSRTSGAELPDMPVVDFF